MPRGDGKPHTKGPAGVGRPPPLFVNGPTTVRLTALAQHGVINLSRYDIVTGGQTLRHNGGAVDTLERHGLVTSDGTTAALDESYPFHKQMLAVLRVFARRYPTLLVPHGRHPRTARNKKRRSVVTDIFGNPPRADVLMFVSAMGVASPIQVERYAIASEAGKATLRHFLGIGVFRDFRLRYRRLYYLNPDFMAARQLAALLRAMTKQRKPEYFGIAAISRATDPQQRRALEFLRGLGH